MITERLIMRPLRAGDLPALVAYRQDLRVARYQSWEPTYSLADAERMLADLEGARIGQPGVGVQTALVDRGDGSLVGDCYSHVLSGASRTAEVGITLAPARQGQGLAREALGRLVGALFETAEIDRVMAQADDRNRPVHRLLEHVGFRLEARLVDAEWLKGEWTTLRVYAVRGGAA